MAEDERRHIDIRSNGDGVIGRVYEMEEGKQTVRPFRGPTRNHMLRKVRSEYGASIDSKIVFARRGITYF